MSKIPADIVAAKASKKTEKLDITLPDPHLSHPTQIQEPFLAFKGAGQYKSNLKN